MTFFERIHINGFRRLADVDLELKPLTSSLAPTGPERPPFSMCFHCWRHQQPAG